MKSADGLVGERLVGLVVADDPVEPLVGGLVVDEVGQVADAAARGIQTIPGDSIA